MKIMIGSMRGAPLWNFNMLFVIRWMSYDEGMMRFGSVAVYVRKRLVYFVTSHS